MEEDNLPIPDNSVDEVVVTSATENLKQAIPTNADGNIILYRSTTEPNVNILSDFTDINMSNQAGLGQQSFYAIDEMYAYNYSRPSINKNVYKFETNIKPNQVLNIQSPTNAQLDVLEKIGITAEDLKNWDMFNTGEVNTKIQNNLDFLLENNIKAIGNNKVGGSPGVFDYEIVPIITEKTQTEIKPVSQLILDPNWEGTDRILNVENELFQSTQSTQWADKYLPIDANDPNTKYRPVYYIDEEGIGKKSKDFQFSEQPIENNLVKDNLIEVSVDTNTNVNLVNDTYVLSTDTPTNVVDDITNFQNKLRDKYADVLADLKMGGMKQPVLVLSAIPERNSFLLSNLYIDETMQGKGYGTQIMNDIIEFADNNNLQVELDISATNKSLAKYYERFGFVLSDETDRDMIRKPGTPTNVVDDVPTLNTDLVWEKEKKDVDTNPQWKDDVIPKNNIFNPTMEYEELSDIVPRILDGTASDVEFARFGIYLLHNSPQPAFGPRGMSDPDMIADVVKIVIFNGKTFQYAINPEIIDNVYGRAELKSGGLPNELTKEVMLQFANEEGVFANAKQRIKQTIINEHNKLYANADDYFILFRSGDLGNNTIQSFSKSGRQAYFIGFLTGQETSRRGGRGVDAYFVNKNDFIDLQALGLDYGSEAEVIVFKQAVDNPYSKAVIPPGEDFNYLSKERVKFLKDNWVMMQDEFPKTGFINSIKPDDPTRNQTLRVMDDTPDATTASTRVQQVAFDFAKTNGLAEPNFNAIAYFNPEVGLEAADIYEGLPDFDDSAVPLYNKFIKETNAQYDALINAGIQFELVDTDPYTPNAAGHKQMINDMQNGRLKVLATSSAGELPEGSPMGKVSKYTDVNGRQMLENDVFRAVHDTFGHGMRGNTFGPIGEYNAWLAHKEMYTPTSQRVMTTETLGQNTYVNFGPHMRTEEGALIGKGDSGYIKPQDRPFAPQKVAIMPDNIITKAGDVATDATGLVNTNAMTKVRNFISNTPDAAESLWKATKFTLGKSLRGLQVLDPGDIAIEYGLARLLPRLGLGAIAAPALYAYVFYELAVLAVDAANGLQKAAEKQGIAGIGEDKDIDWKQLGKDTWSEMGEVSDDWSLSWKISEPIINGVFEEYGKMKAAKEEKDYFSNLETGLAPR